MSKNVAIITGASGLLGRKVYKTFKESGQFDQVVGLAFSRAGDELVKLDITNKDELTKLFENYKPKVLIHCAAERFPDKVEGNKEGTLKLNVQSTETLGSLCKQYSCRLVYISTDYVFDGTNPPYQPNHKPNPLNFYGETKYQGELALSKVGDDYIVLRIPVLYGEVTYLKESAVNCLIDVVKGHNKPAKMDHVMPRCPTYVGDIARTCLEISDKSKHPQLPNIIHIANPKSMTKYDMCVILGKIYNRNIDHITPVTKKEEAVGADRPENVQFDISETVKLDLVPYQFTEFEVYFEKQLV